MMSQVLDSQFQRTKLKKKKKFIELIEHYLFCNKFALNVQSINIKLSDLHARRVIKLKAVTNNIRKLN